MVTTKSEAANLHEQALLYLESDQIDEAMAACQQAIELDSKYPPAHICLGRIYRRQNDLDSAISSIEKGLALQPKLANGYFLLGEIYFEQQNFNLAIGAYQKYLDLQPSKSNVYFKLAEAYSRNQQFEQAYLNCVKALEQDPNPQESYFRRVLRLGFISTASESLLRQYVVQHPQLASRLQANVKYQSPVANIYHCCPPRTGSQWMKGILQDFRVFQHSGLAPLPLDFIKGLVQEPMSTHQLANEPNAIPPRTVVTGTFTVTFQQFQAMPKPECYRAFFVLRDPRDLVVSTYFANKKSHRLAGHIAKTREVLNSLSLTEGLIYQLESLSGVFKALRSWAENCQADPNVLLVRFEDLTGAKQFETFETLFKHCDIQMPAAELRQMLEDNSFKKLSGGREKGQEDSNSHYRKGTHGDWQNYFDDKVHQRFTELTGDLVHLLGYTQLE